LSEKKKPFPGGNLKNWASVAWVLKDEFGKKPSEEESHLKERQREADEFSRRRWRGKKGKCG